MRLKNLLAASLMTLSALALDGCGFHLRGIGESAALPFQKLAVEGGGPVGERMIRQLRYYPGVTLAPPDQAQAIIVIEGEKTEKLIRSINQAGKVSEYELRLTMSYRIDAGNREPLVASSNIAARRFMTYDDNHALGKDAEEALLYQDMRNDAGNQILRRLMFLKPQADADATPPGMPLLVPPTAPSTTPLAAPVAPDVAPGAVQGAAQ